MALIQKEETVFDKTAIYISGLIAVTLFKLSVKPPAMTFAGGL